MNARHLLHLLLAGALAALLTPRSLGGTPALADFGYQNMKVNGSPALGVRPLLIVLLDLAGTHTFAHDESYYRNLVFDPFNTTPAGVRSVNGYFLVNSHGRFGITPAGRGIIGPAQLPANVTAQVLTNDVMKAGYAVNRASQDGFDFSAYDSNHDGTVTADELMILVFDNINGVDSGAARWANIDGVNGVPFTPFGSSVAVGMPVGLMTQRVSFATLCHELSHILGTEDLYGLWNQTCHNAGYTLMSCTISPSSADSLASYNLDAWHKMQLGWIEPRIHSLDAGGVQTLTAPQAVETNDGPMILYDPNVGASEYFLVEYRTSTSPWGAGYDDDLPSNGLGIWHVTQDAGKNLIQITNVGQSVWLEGQPDLQRSQDNKELWTSATMTPALRWLDGSAANSLLKVEPFNSGDGAIAFDLVTATVVKGAKLPPAETNAETLTFDGSSSMGGGGFEIQGGITTFQDDGSASGLLLRGDGGLLRLLDSATAETASILVDGGMGNGGIPGYLEFKDSSTAAAAAIVNRSPALGPNFKNATPNPDNGWGAITEFSDNATAGTARIINEGEDHADASNGASGGMTRFSGNASADHAALEARGSPVNGTGGYIEFTGSATAGNATVINLNGATGLTNASGHTAFFDAATAGHASFTNIGGAGGSFETGGFTDFRGSSTADHATFTSYGGTGGMFPGPGVTRFFDTATAAHGNFISRPGYSTGGNVEFRGRATAGDATFTNDSPVGSIGGAGGNIIFKDDSTASRGIFTTTGYYGGNVWFWDRSRADHGTFRIDPNVYDGRIEFYGTASADQGVFDIGGGGYIQFYGSSTASNATIVLRANGTVGKSSTGSFSDNTTADNANITVMGAEIPGMFGADLSFRGPATAGQATITVNGASVTTFGASGGDVSFSSGAGLGTATLIANGGANGGAGGSIRFNGAPAGQAHIILNAGGSMDVSGLADTHVGSLEGAGSVWLDHALLAVGSLNTDTTFSGGISGRTTPPLGAFVKEGAGTFTLSGTNTFKGLSTVAAGTLVVNGSLASDVQVNAGAKLEGTNRISGTVTVLPGGIAAPGTSPGTLTIEGGYIQEPQGILEIEVAGPNPREQDHLVVSGNVNLGGTLLLVFSGYAPSANETFPVLEAGGSFIDNHFNILVLGLKPGFQSGYQFSGGKLIVTATSGGLPRSAGDPIQTLKPWFVPQSEFVFPVFTIAGAAYRFDTSTDLKAWTPISEVPGANALVEFRYVPPATDPHRFFRIVQTVGSP